MSIAEGVKPLPAFTAGQWLTVYLKEDASMTRRWLNVMHQMDRQYQQENVGLFQRSLSHCPNYLGAAYYYWTPTCELVLRMAYNADHRRHEIGSVGFLGEIAPQDALDLIVDRAVLHMIERSLTSIFCFCPKQIDYAPLLELYDLVPVHPRIRLTLEADTPHFRKWTLEALELLGN